MGKMSEWDIDKQEIVYLQARLAIYQQTMNRIDDYFEYHHRSGDDQRAVHHCMSQLTLQLQSLERARHEPLKPAD